ncbi:monofunctional biosynthetic peptidoglycan transglycosylase [Dyadobacter fermentans]|uniref:Biosynthetic peptidoglycan transglycosylase n=1 Tax=Dyadobacter fermentans (strain ATCC 700827 / DSM 18053 / CIP 107007 / KCTC 52180 / NS114) TaxID=471854 RepID=C6W0M4_DYAFD|nr:monofunctional biosynthetic peptidoglycan transglycosylase [Dyadobacter fermentans]ACT93630.1 monofunctional biosynthetic peptidoglycan transglycosylase [Dyadobacter fermentans DSM 18053]
MLRRLQFIALRIFLAFIVISVVWVVVLRFVPVWVTPYMISRKIDAFKADEDTEIHHDWEPYENISKEAALAVVASEDQNFPNHWGFDFDQIYNAMTEDRKRARGASTISQQVAKNVFLWHGRSFIRKGLEAYFTVLIEVLWSKKRILEVYLNVAEMGKMTFGVEAASLRYYNKSAKRLTRYEAARIAAVLPNPIRFSIQNPSAYVNKRTNQIVRQMRYLGGQKYLADL